jgi:peptidoglycan/xylan/chitin deacetylase (PgdA/CDA1 family)
LTATLRSAGRRALIGAYTVGVTSSGIDRHRLRRVGKAHGLVVLNLHNVSPVGGRFTRPIPPEVFEELVRWLGQACHLTTFGELSTPARDDTRPAAILSFDDGYRDFVEYAMPILERHGVRANQNIVPASVDSGRPPWNVGLLNALEAIPAERLQRLELPEGELAMPGSLEDEQVLMRWGVELSRVLKMRSREERVPLVNALTEQLDGELAGTGPPMMCASEVAEAASHHEVGVHSYAHDSMEFETDDFFADDVRSCRDWYRAHIGTEARVYAFPNGSHRREQVELARQGGFDHVLLVGERVSSAGASVHPRITADGVSLRELRMRLARAC